MPEHEWMHMIEDLEELKFLARTKLITPDKLTLTPAEMELLLMIYLKQGELGPGQVSELMHMKRESISRVIRSLLNKGDIIKVKCPEDERRCSLELTADGQRELDMNYKRILKPLYYLKKSMGEDFKTFMDMVASANRLMKQYEEEI